MTSVAHMHNNDDLMSTREVADLRGVDVATVNRWAKRGVLPVAVKAHGPKGANLYLRSDVEALLADADGDAA